MHSLIIILKHRLNSYLYGFICLLHCMLLIHFHRVTKQSKEEFFIKWRDVPYNLSTWERPDDHVNSQIRFVVCCLSLGKD